MFDIGFLELVLISIVGLLVLGPERLPVAIRTVGLYVGKLRRSFNSVRADIEQELKNDEIRRSLQDQDVMKQLREVEREIKKGLEGFDDEEPEQHTVGPKIEPPAADKPGKSDTGHADAADSEADDAHADAAASEADDAHADAADSEADDAHADAGDRGESAESTKP